MAQTRPAPPARPAPAAPAAPTVSKQSPAADYTPNVRFRLRTELAEGRMVFIGFGGAIDGVVDPELVASEGDVVQVTLINGEGAEHDIVFEQPAVTSQHVVGKGASTTVAFRAGGAGASSYFCSLPGHRQAGMEGKFTVKAKPAEVPVAAAPSISLDPASVPPPIGNRPPDDRARRSRDGRNRRSAGRRDDLPILDLQRPCPRPVPARARRRHRAGVHSRTIRTQPMIHSVDFHAVTGPGGGAAYLQSRSRRDQAARISRR